MSSAGGLKQLGGTATMSQAAGNSGVKMIVVSSGQLAQTQSSKPITISMPGGQKTVTLSAGGGKGGQIVQTSSGQILQLPAGGLMSAGGKPVTVQMAGGGQKTLTLVQAPKVEQQQQQPQIVSAVTSADAADAAAVASAAESIKLEDHLPPQVDGGVATPPNEPAAMDIDELNKLGMFFSQLDGADDEDEQETSTTNEPSAGSETNPQEQTASGGDDPTPASANADQDESEENMKTDVKQEPRSDNMPELDDDSEQQPSKDATSASTSNVKNEPKDPLAQAMDELTGGGGKNDDDADKSNDDMDGASALAALASAAASTAENSSENGKSTKEKSSSSNGTSSSKDPQEAKRDANWFDVGIIKGSSCTVSSYYLPSGDGERPEIDVEGMHKPLFGFQFICCCLFRLTYPFVSILR